MNGSRLLRELFGLLFLFFGLLMFLSLWTHHPADPSFNVMDSTTVTNVQNAAGPFGSYLSGILIDFFGVVSYIFVLFFLVIGVELISRWVVIKWYRWIGYFCLFYCSMTFFSKTGLGFHNIYGGGFLGTVLRDSVSQYLTPPVSFFFWILCLIVTLELALNISPIKLTLKTILFLIHLIISLGKRLNISVSGPESSKKKITSYLEAYEKRPRLHLDILGWKRSKEISVPEIQIQDSPFGAGTANTETALNGEDQGNAGKKIDNEEGKKTGSEELGLYSIPIREELDSHNDSVLTFLKDSMKQGKKELEEEDKDEAKGKKAEDDSLLFLKAAVSKLSQEVKSEDESIPSLSMTEEKNDLFSIIEESSSSDRNKEHKASYEPMIIEQAVTSVSETALIQITPTEKGEEIRKEESESQNIELPTPPEPLREDTADNDAINQIVSRATESQEQEKSPVVPRPKAVQLPSYDLLDPLKPEDLKARPDSNYLQTQGEAVISCLKNFHVDASLAKITPGPVITMFEIRPAPGVKATKITNLADDLAMSLKALSVRMQAPVPGSDTVGVEIPNAIRQTVFFREIIQDESFFMAKSLLTIAIGKTTIGNPYCADLSKMPHLLVAGATGQGKSVCLNSILISLLYRAKPDEVQFILVDPKRVEFSMYADLPHLVHPVVTEMDLTKNALLWAVAEMERRMKLFSELKVKNIKGFNELQNNRRNAAEGIPLADSEELKKMPYLVIVVDELGDLMMLKRKEVESPIIRLAQLGRAAGIHLIIATQRPSVDVVTGLIKVNFPCRIAFKVTSSQDSRTILDGVGAEKLLGNGDMLFKSSTGELMRIHGAFVSDKEVMSVVEYWKRQQRPCYKVDFAEFGGDSESDDINQHDGIIGGESDDPLYAEAIQFVIDSQKRPSVSLVQRRFRIGFNRAARLMEEMERDGVFRKFDDPNNL